MPFVQLRQERHPHQDIADMLNKVLSGVTKYSQDKAIRSGAAKILGKDVSELTGVPTDVLTDAMKETMKPYRGGYKPETKEDWLEGIDTEYRGKIALAVATAKAKAAEKPGSPESQEKWEKEQKRIAEEELAKKQDWGDVDIMNRLRAAITPSKTPEEQKFGGLRPGGVLKPPTVAQPAVTPQPVSPVFGGRGGLTDIQPKKEAFDKELLEKQVAEARAAGFTDEQIRIQLRKMGVPE